MVMAAMLPAVHPEGREDPPWEDLPGAGIEPFGDADGAAPRSAGYGRKRWRGRRIRELEGPGVRDDGAIEVLGDLRAHRRAELFAELEDHLADGRGLGVDPVDVGVGEIGIVVVDIDLGAVPQVLLARAGDVRALQQDDTVVAGWIDLTDPDAAGVREVAEREGGGVPVDDVHLFAEALAHHGQGEARANGIAVRPQMGGDRDAAALPDPAGDVGGGISFHVSGPSRSAGPDAPRTRGRGPAKK
jgi:hypothetical protein